MMTPTFTLKSKELGGQLNIEQYSNVIGYTGQNRTPQLSWENAPKDTKAFALTLYDLDAPTGSGFWHWVVFNIPAHISELHADAGDPAKNLLPANAIQSNTDMGTLCVASLIR